MATSEFIKRSDITHSLIGPYAWRVFANKPRTFKFGEQFLDVFYVGERAFSSVFTIASSEQSRVGEFSRPLPASRVCRTLFLKLLDFFALNFYAIEISNSSADGWVLPLNLSYFLSCVWTKVKFQRKNYHPLWLRTAQLLFVFLFLPVSFCS